MSHDKFDFTDLECRDRRDNYCGRFESIVIRRLCEICKEDPKQAQKWIDGGRKHRSQSAGISQPYETYCGKCEFFRKSCKYKDGFCLLRGRPELAGKTLLDLWNEKAGCPENKWPAQPVQTARMEFKPPKNPHVFFTKDRQHLAFENLYKGNTCFLVAGGPTLKDMGFEYYNYMLSRPGIVSMSINNIGNFIRTNFWIANDDPDRFSPSIWNDPSIIKLTVTGHKNRSTWSNESREYTGKSIAGCPGVVYFNSQTWEGEFDPKFWFEKTALCLGWSPKAKTKSARSTFMMALHALYYLGFEKVYIIGADFKMSGEKKYAFDEKREGYMIRYNNKAFEQMNEIFTMLAPYFLRHNFNVFNCTKNSGLTAFPYVDFNEAIAVSTIAPQTSCEGYYASRDQKLGKYDYKFTGPLGDALCSLPAIAAYKEKHKVELRLSTRNIDVSNLLFASGVFAVQINQDGRKLAQSNSLDLRVRFAEKLGVKLINKDIPELKISAVPPAELKGAPYVCICNEASGPKAKVRTINLVLWAGIVKYVKSLGYKTVQVGQKSPIIPGADLNLVGKTKLMRLGEILKAARFLVSIDTGVPHYAHAVRTPQVVLYTVADAKDRVYSDTIPVQLENCSLCRSTHNKPVECPEKHFKCGGFTLDDVKKGIDICDSRISKQSAG